MDIHENLVLGIDLGIASCGWAVIDRESSAIVGMGSRIWDAPETDKERTPTNQLRRLHRGMRRVLKRRRQRMNAIRKLFRDHGLIEVQGSTGLRIARLDPWELRAHGLDRKLTGPELAVALGHIAKHRGFKSNAKRDRGANATDESSKMLKAIGETQDRLAHYHTVGEMFFKDEAFAGRKRNRDGEFTRSVLRDDQAKEVEILFLRQRGAGNSLATPELEKAFCDVAFTQRPLQDSDALVGDCPFEPGQKRASKHAPSFEHFRMLSRLAAIRLTEGRNERALTADQIAAVDGVFGDQKSLKWTRLRKLIGISDATTFAGVSAEDENKNDFVGRASNAAEGTASLRTVGAGGGHTLREMTRRVGSGDPGNIEAQAARYYWGKLWRDFRREDSGDRRNMMLNYGYAVVRSGVARALVGTGLIPAFGLKHASVSNAFNLADDLVEPFRPFVDVMVWHAIGEGAACREDMTVTDRRTMAGILLADARLGTEAVTLLTASEKSAESVVRAFETATPAVLTLPTLQP